MNDASLEPAAQALLAPWPGEAESGSLPLLDGLTPAQIEAALHAAIGLRRARVEAIATSGAAPSFDNTVAALEASAVELKRAKALYQLFSTTQKTGDMAAVERRVAPLLAAHEDAIAHDARLFARLDAVHHARQGLPGAERRLVEVLHDSALRRGAALPAAGKARLSEINTRLATLVSRFGQNLLHDQEQQWVWTTDAAELDGVPEATVGALAQAAAAQGRPDAWAVANQRGVVWPVLTHARSRALRERVWRMWSLRGDHRGEHDNRPVMAEILRLRGEKARLLGFPSYAHLACSARMAGTPQKALSLLHTAWQRVRPASVALLAELQAVADADADASGRRFTLAPWDRLFYTEALRRSRFGVDGEAVRPYLPLDAVVQMLLHCASRLHGLDFDELPDAPRVDPAVRVFALLRDGRRVGTLLLDLYERAGKQRGSWQMELRAAENMAGQGRGATVAPVALLSSGVQPPAPGQPALLAWDQANVIFHEFGHALHMLLSQAPWATLGPMGVPWDFVELPALLNERWLFSRELLERFARHHASGEPLPPPWSTASRPRRVSTASSASTSTTCCRPSWTWNCTCAPPATRPRRTSMR